MSQTGVPIPPTPIVGMVGLIEKESHITRPGFQEEENVIGVLGPLPQGLGGSEFAKRRLGPDQPGERLWGNLPECSLSMESRLHRVTLDAIRAGWVCSAHDVSEGGLAVAIVECCLASPKGLGAEINHAPGSSVTVALFGELPPRIVLSARPKHAARIADLAKQEHVMWQKIGHVKDSKELFILGSINSFGRFARRP